MDKIQKIKAKIGKLKSEYYKESVFRTVRGDTAEEVLDKILSFIDSLSEEHVSEDLEEELHSWMRENCDDNGFFNQLELARHFAEWQRKQDESRRKANIALANTDVPKDKDLDIAFEDIWSDVENYISESYNLSDEQKCKLKNAHHDTFEAGAIWQRKKDQETIELAEDHAMLAGMNKMKEEIFSKAVSETTLIDWYISSIDETIPPIWTEAHINELYKDFYLIQKEALQ